MLELIDASHYQGTIDFDQVYSAGYAGAIVKAIEGRLPSVDPMFRANWAALLERPELVRGAYSFARPNTDGGGESDGRAEGEDFARVMLEAGAGGDWIAVVDLERGGMDPKHSAQQNQDWLSAWVEACERELGLSPWIYTGEHTWRDRMGWTSMFDHLPLWQAAYTSSPAPMPWPLTLWQYTADGSVPGIEGRVDLNRFDGSLEQLRDLARPQIYTRYPVAIARGPIFAPLDLAGSGPWSLDVARVQGLLFAAGQSLDIDGRRGPVTRAAYASVTGLESTAVDWVALHS